MQIIGAVRDDDLITFFHPSTAAAAGELAPRSVIGLHTVISFALGQFEWHQNYTFQRVYVQLMNGARLDFTVKTSPNGNDFDFGLIALVVELLTGAMQ